jgi:Spy/CpxP family protein refolding chaperone
MKRLVPLALALALVALAASAALAQPGFRPGGFGGGTLFLLTQKSVQEELKLSEDQVKKVTELDQKQREAFRDFRDLSREERQQKMQEMAKANDKAIGEILKEDQLKRVKQISLQQQGARALGTPEVADALKLTDEQKDKVKGIQEESAKEFRELFQGGGDRDEVRKKMEALRKSTEEKLMGVLTDDQKTKWKELQGEPFKGEIRRPGFGGGPGGGPLVGPPPGAFGGGKLFLLTQKSVQEELKLSDDQVKKVAELGEKQRDAFQGLRNLGRDELRKKFEEMTKDTDKAIADTLKEDQLKRFNQIALQQQGTRALGDPEVADALKLSPEQKDKVKAVQEEARREFGALFQGGGDPAEGRKKMEELRKATDEKLMNVLTDEQKAKWKELQGEPFKGEIRRPGFGGGRAGRRPART